MLFEREPLTPKERLAELGRLFSEVALKKGNLPVAGHVPVAILEAYSELATHVRFILEAARNQPRQQQNKLLARIERLLDTLPDNIVSSLQAKPDENWLLPYRGLVQLHGFLEELEPGLDASDYSSIVQKMIQLAHAVSKAAAVEVHAGSMFALLLMQVHLHQYSSPKRRRPRKKDKGPRKKDKK